MDRHQVTSHELIEAPFEWKGASLRHRTGGIRSFRPRELFGALSDELALDRAFEPRDIQLSITT